jgi:DNA-binding phage protein
MPGKTETALRNAAERLQQAKADLDAVTADERELQRRKRAATRTLDQRREALAKIAKSARAEGELSMTEIAEIAGLNRSYLYQLLGLTKK